MAQDEDSEQPLNKFARFKNNKKLWYQEMNNAGLTKEEQNILEPIIGLSYGICESQEKFMQLVQIPECGGFPLGWADRLRKSIAKKNPTEYMQLTKEYFEAVEAKGLSKNLCNYVWNTLVATSRGYGFNASHTLAYSLVALQEMNLAFKYPVLFWNCACLITDSGGAENSIEEESIFFDEAEDLEAKDKEDEKKKKTRSTNYKKIATAIGKMQQAGVKVEPPNINKSSFTFTPDAENNRILYGLSGILSVGDDVIKDTIRNRPYASVRDYYERVKPKKQAMVSLIKGGAFDDMMERKTCMAWYVWETCDKKKNLTLSNMPGLMKYQLVPQDTEERINARKVYEFNRYLKAICKETDGLYLLDTRAINFLQSFGYEDLIQNINAEFYLNKKIWEKKYQIWMDVFRKWITSDKENILHTLNSKIFQETWKDYAEGSFSAWEMEALSFYYHDHELINVNTSKYGIVNFFEQPEEPIVERTFKKGNKEIKMFKLVKIIGTCIAKDKNKGTVTLLTPDGVVNVKFRKEYMAMYDKQISVRRPDGTKMVIQKSWFNRGEKIMVMGIRSGDNFIVKKYASSPGEQLYKIVELINNNTELVLTHDRPQGESEDAE